MSDAAALPLAGIRVIDLTRILAGPLATMTLGDLGADVIKVERPGTGDETRRWGPPFRGDDAVYHLAVNRNKRSIVVDLDQEEGRATVAKLVAGADVLIENFRPGFLDSIGLGYDVLSRTNPGLVHCRIATLPDAATRAIPGYDLVIQAMSGLMSITGDAGGEPTKVGVAITDVLTGLYSVIGIQAALRARDENGAGQSITVSLFESAVTGLVNQWSNYLNGGIVPRQIGNRHPNITPYEPFDASDGKFILAAATDRDYQRTCEVIGRPELATDPRFATNGARLDHREELHAQIAPIFLTRTVDEWLDLLQAASVPSGPIRSMDAVFASQEGQAMIEEVDDPDRDGLRLVAGPLKLRGMERVTRLRPPLVGEHTTEILAELAADDDPGS